MQRFKIDTAAPQAPEATLLIIYTGGTSGMILDPNKSLIPFDFRLILENVPTLKHFNLVLNVVSFDEPVDSSNMYPKHWVMISEIIEREYENHDGFVVLHGTDTMAYTASAISFMLEGLQKPVVFTGAQLPVSSPRSDAHENLITSIEIAAAKINGKARVPEVSIYFDYMLYRANRAKKVESQHFDAFSSENYPPLAKAGISIEYDDRAIRQVDENAEWKVHKTVDDRVAILKLFPGFNKVVAEKLLEIQGIRGLVLETFGSGNAPTDPGLIDILKSAIDRGIIILNVSQCVGGHVIQGKYETSRALSEIGVIGGEDLTTEAAITKMMSLFGRDYETAEIKKLLTTSLRGEMEDRK